MRRAGALAAAAALLLSASWAQAAPRALIEGGVADVDSSAWSPPLLLGQVASFGATRCGEWLYVYSGHTGPTHHHSHDNLSPVFARVSLIDGRGWELLPCPERLQSSVLVTYRGAVVRVGGMTARNRAGEPEDLHSVDAVSRFDPLAREWSALPPLPEPRSSHGAVIVGDRLYVVGGWTLAGERALWCQTALSLDLSADEPRWTELPRPPFSERRALALAAADGKVVALGGMTSEGEFTSEVHLYDPATRAWSVGPPFPFPGFGVAARGVGRDVYASGIGSSLHRLGLHGGEPEWEALGSLMLPRYFHELIRLEDERLLAVGGVTRREGDSPRNAHLRVMEVLDVSAHPAPALHTWTLPYPGRAKNRQGVFLYRDALWVFGGNDSLAQHDFGPENFLAEGFRIDLTTHRVEALPPFPAERQSMRTTVLRGETAAGLVVGGFFHAGEGTRSSDEVHTFDFATRAWERSALTLPRPRTQFALVQRAGRTYALGGLDYDSTRPRDEAFGFPTEVLVAEERAFVSAGVALPRPRRAFGAALLGESLVLAGGMREGFALLDEVDVYDFAAERWSTLPPPRDPRISPHLLALGEKLVLIGGTTPKGGDSFAPNQRVEVFDPAVGAWSTLIEELPLSVRHMRFFVWRDRILCYSVQAEGAGAARLLVIEPK